MNQPIWISHRGRCYNGVENTRASFKHAANSGFVHFETDLRCTADGHIVLCHDPDLRQISNAPLAMRKIQQENLQTLANIPLKDQQSLMTFEQLIAEFNQYRWIFDIKPESAMQTLNVLLNTWWGSEWKWFFEHHVRFLLWRKDHQEFLAHRRKKAQFMASLTECKRADLACLLGLPQYGSIKRGVTYALPARFYGYSLFTEKMVQRFHQFGAKVLAYLPQNNDELQLALAAHADEILLDGYPHEDPFNQSPYRNRSV